MAVAPGLVRKLTAPAVLLAVGGLALYALGRWDQYVSKRDSDLDRQTKAAVKSYEGLHDLYSRAKLAQVEAEKEASGYHRRAEVALGVADSLQKVLRSVTPRLLAAAKTCQDSVLVLSGALSSCQEQTDSLRSANTALISDTVTLSRSRNAWKLVADSADQVSTQLRNALQAEHNARDCKILFFKCPSRALTAGIFTVLGFGLGKL